MYERCYGQIGIGNVKAMWGRSLRLGALGARVGGRVGGRRAKGYLSSEYGCDEAWSRRAEVSGEWAKRPDELYSRLERRASRHQQAVSLVDVDLFVRCARTDQLGEVRDILHKTRSSALAHLSLPSTNYAVIRLFDEAAALPELVHILDDRLNYGLFLDRFTANMLFDKLLQRRDYPLASKLAGFLMLQEDFEGPITEQLALYSAYKYLELPLPVRVPVVEEPVKVTGKKKKVEEIKIRVAFLRNPFFDDHFDLTDDRMIAGKTLAVITSNRDDSTSCDCNLLGWVFYKKFDKAASAARRLVKKGEIYKETLDRLQHVLENHDETDALGAKMLGDILSTIKNIPISEKSMEDEITNSLKKTIEEHQRNEIERHVQVNVNCLLKMYLFN